ncbi:peptide-methionine (S)-S-oxide reductase MsrA [Prevotella sp. OH937_COT-195]|uniref:peptide-methionine (S)-S-oxide reductase MsrA n=1 Tax=Prevotella sp. OH937_COT-195 TaxID=2491051 RepID=UPI001F3EEFC7|nr:peptide-methionine (S)-S-oxide reductase MsrA [Prevotella sp. OH937_COT-195]
MKEIYFAGGCFWGTEHYFKQLRGVVETHVGYANGNIDNPTYKEVCTDKTGFTETVRVVYNPDVITLDFLTEMYFKAVDPTSVNKQGNDVGSQYRTGIYFKDDADKPELQKVYDRVQQKVGSKLAVELLPLNNFYDAEEYHQDYLDKNPEGYCHLPASLFKMAKEANSRK